MLVKRNKISNMIGGLDPEEQAFAQYHIGVSLCETFKECIDMKPKEISNMMERLYEMEPISSRKISDEMFDERRRRVNKISPMMIGKKYVPILKKTGMLEISEGIGGARYRLNGYKKVLLSN